MTVKEAIASRKSVRTYTGEKISDEELKTLLTAAQAAPIGMGAYDSMHLTVITDPQLLAAINDNAKEFFKNPNANVLFDCPTLIVVSTKLGTAMDAVAYANAAIVVENMALQAVELGIGVCHIWGAIMGMKGKDELIARLGLPEGFSPVCAATFGKTDFVYEEREIPEDRIAVNYI